MAIDAGRMQHRIRFLAGDDDTGWNPVKTVWAAVIPLSARERITQVREIVESHKILCRYTSGIDTTMRIQCKDRTFRIVSIINYDERNVDLTIMAEELTNGRQL